MHGGSQATLDEIIDYNLKSRKVTKFFSNVFTGEGAGGHGHTTDESRLKEKLARKKKKKLKEHARNSAKSDGDSEKQKPKRPVKVAAPSPTIAEGSSDITTVRDGEASPPTSIEGAEDVYGMKADPKKCIIKETADILHSIGTSPQPEAVAEVVISSDESEESESVTSSEDDLTAVVERSAWDYATALDEEDVTSHRRVVCVPQNLIGSKVILCLTVLCSDVIYLFSNQNGWGDPSQSLCMQFTNYSRIWTIELSWVGEDSALVSRALLHESATHVEVMSPEHVWCITAYRKSTTSKNEAKKDVIDPVEKSLLEADEYGNYSEDVSGYSSVSVLFRPPPISNPTMYTPGLSVLWVPWYSLSFAELSRRNSAAKHASDDRPDDSFICFKIFDYSPVSKHKKDAPSRKK